MFALEQLNHAKRCVHENLPNATIMRINLAIEWIHKALDIAPSDEAMKEVMEASHEDVRAEA
jgi:hypothetical protein